MKRCEAETTAASLIDEIMKSSLKEIDFLSKAEEYKATFSSKKVLDVCNELNKQIYAPPEQEKQIQQQTEHNNLRIDSLMSVNIVQRKPPPRRGRSKTRFMREIRNKLSFQQSISNKRSRRRTTFDKIEPLPDLEEREKSSSESENSSNRRKKADDSNQNAIQKPISMKTYLKNQIPQQKQPFSYDYTGQILKVKKKGRGHLVSSENGAFVEIPKKAEKVKVEKKRKVSQVWVKEVKRITEKKKKKEERRRRRKTMIKQEELPIVQPIQVEFSNIKNLSQHLSCSPGVSFSQGSQTIRNRSIQPFRSVGDIDPKKCQLSRQEYQLLKKKSERSQYSHSKLSTIDKEVSNKPQDARSFSVLQKGVSSYRPKTQIIIINDDLLHEELISEPKPLIRTPTKAVKKTEYHSKQSKIVMSPTDKFNQKYIRSKLSLQNPKNTASIVTGGFILPKIRDLTIKNRQKLQNRGFLFHSMKKQFQQTLRGGDQSPNFL